jgi:hypothetical protein
MNNRTSKTLLFLLLALVFSACNSNSSVTVTATQAIPQTATSTAPPRPATATWYLKTATPVLPTPPPDDIGYFDGVIIITQYYTFLDHGLYEEAYQLLSSSARDRLGSLEDYVAYQKSWFKELKIISIVPQYLRTNSVDRRKFIASIMVWNEKGISENFTIGENYTL